MKSLALDIKVLTEDHDEIKLRGYSDDDDFEPSMVKSDEALEEIDLQGLGFGDDATKDAFNVFDDNQADDEDISNIFGGNDDNDISSLFGTSNDDDASSLFDDKESDKE